VAQALAQVPQLAGSAAVSTHRVPHLVLPPLHCRAQVLALQT
jgi:hypothetical protein